MSDFAQAHARLLRAGGIQFRFPDAAPDPTASAPAETWSLPSYANHFFWAIVMLIVAALATLLVHYSWTRVRPLRAPGKTDAAPDVIPALATDETDPAALAETKRYGAAVHALLLRCIAQIRAHHPGLLRPLHTGREIAALNTLPLPLRPALTGLVELSEHAVFAQRELGKEEWEAGRTCSAALLSPANWP